MTNNVFEMSKVKVYRYWLCYKNMKLHIKCAAMKKKIDVYIQ